MVNWHWASEHQGRRGKLAGHSLAADAAAMRVIPMPKQSRGFLRVLDEEGVPTVPILSGAVVRRKRMFVGLWRAEP